MNVSDTSSKLSSKWLDNRKDSDGSVELKCLETMHTKVTNCGNGFEQMLRKKMNEKPVQIPDQKQVNTVNLENYHFTTNFSNQSKLAQKPRCSTPALSSGTKLKKRPSSAVGNRAASMNVVTLEPVCSVNEKKSQPRKRPYSARAHESNNLPSTTKGKWAIMLNHGPNFNQKKLQDLEQETYNLLQTVLNSKPSGVKYCRRYGSTESITKKSSTKESTRRQRSPSKFNKGKNMPCGTGLSVAKHSKANPKKKKKRGESRDSRRNYEDSSEVLKEISSVSGETSCRREHSDIAPNSISLNKQHKKYHVNKVQESSKRRLKSSQQKTYEKNEAAKHIQCLFRKKKKRVEHFARHTASRSSQRLFLQKNNRQLRQIGNRSIESTIPVSSQKSSELGTMRDHKTVQNDCDLSAINLDACVNELFMENINENLSTRSAVYNHLDELDNSVILIQKIVRGKLVRNKIKHLKGKIENRLDDELLKKESANARTILGESTRPNSRVVVIKCIDDTDHDNKNCSEGISTSSTPPARNSALKENSECSNHKACNIIKPCEKETDGTIQEKDVDAVSLMSGIAETQAKLISGNAQETRRQVLHNGSQNEIVEKPFDVKNKLDNPTVSEVGDLNMNKNCKKLIELQKPGNSVSADSNRSMEIDIVQIQVDQNKEKALCILDVPKSNYDKAERIKLTVSETNTLNADKNYKIGLDSVHGVLKVEADCTIPPEVKSVEEGNLELLDVRDDERVNEEEQKCNNPATLDLLSPKLDTLTNSKPLPLERQTSTKVRKKLSFMASVLIETMAFRFLNKLQSKKKHIASSRIQRQIRAFLVNIKYKHSRRKKKAAIKIQRQYRAYHTRLQMIEGLKYYLRQARKEEKRRKRRLEKAEAKKMELEDLNVETNEQRISRLLMEANNELQIDVLSLDDGISLNGVDDEVDLNATPHVANSNYDIEMDDDWEFLRAIYDRIEENDSSWEKYQDPQSEKSFYFNPETGISQWHSPKTNKIAVQSDEKNANTAQDTEQENRSSTSAPWSLACNVQKWKIRRMNSIRVQAVGEWEEYTDENGYVFYYNNNTGESRWQKEDNLTDMINVMDDESSKYSTKDSTTSDTTNKWKLRRENSIRVANVDKDWDRLIDNETQKSFYYNNLTGESSWEQPSTSVSNLDFSHDWIRCEDQGSNKSYYYNNKSGECQWERPEGFIDLNNELAIDEDDEYTISIGDNLCNLDIG